MLNILSIFKMLKKAVVVLSLGDFFYLSLTFLNSFTLKLLQIRSCGCSSCEVFCPVCVNTDHVSFFWLWLCKSQHVNFFPLTLTCLRVAEREASQKALCSCFAPKRRRRRKFSPSKEKPCYYGFFTSDSPSFARENFAYYFLSSVTRSICFLCLV